MTLTVYDNVYDNFRVEYDRVDAMVLFVIDESF